MKNTLPIIVLIILQSCTATVSDNLPPPPAQSAAPAPPPEDATARKTAITPPVEYDEMSVTSRCDLKFNPSGTWAVNQKVTSSTMDGIKEDTEYNDIWVIKWNPKTKEISVSGDDGQHIYRGGWSGNVCDETKISQRVSVFLDSRIYTVNVLFDPLDEATFSGQKTRVDNPEGYTAEYEITGKMVY
jgi:hypothetical protein